MTSLVPRHLSAGRSFSILGLIAAAASLATGAASAQECTANGVTGRCRNMSECAAIGWSTPGKCPGPDDFQCCTISTCPGGKCLRTSACGGTSTSGLCPGPADVQCCTATKNPTPSPSPPADLRFDIRVFIPTQLLDITSIFNLNAILPDFARDRVNDLINQIKWGNGDDRGFAVSGGSSKAGISFTVLTNAGGTSSGFDNLQNADVRKHIGESKLYFGGIDTSHCGDAGVPNWGCGRLQSGAKPYLTQGQDITDKKLNVQTKSVGPAAGRALVKISVENGIGDLFDRAFNALIKAMSFPLPIPDVNFPTGPAIDADFNIMVTYVGPRRVKVAIAGTHDGFPSYEVYVNGKPLYQFDAIDPTALFPGHEQTIGVKTIDLDI